MQIGGLQKYSFLDYPGKLSCVIFIQGCNWRCSYCHNKQLWEERPGKISKKELFQFLSKRKNVLEGIVISGGEPTFGNDLLGFIKELKQFQLPIKLDTNGSFPDILEEVLPYLDYVAMDIKTYFNRHRYEEITGVPINIEDIKRSIHLVLQSCVRYHFRTTIDKNLITAVDKVKLDETMKEFVHIYQTKR